MYFYSLAASVLLFCVHVAAIQQRQTRIRAALSFSPPETYAPSRSAQLSESPQLPRLTDPAANLAGASAEVDSATAEAVARAQDSTGNATGSAVPDTGKEAKARQKGNFITDLITPAAETFAAVNPAEKEAEANSDVHHFQEEVLSAFRTESESSSEGEEIAPKRPLQRQHTEQCSDFVVSPSASLPCRQDFSQSCPSDFRLRNGVCVALDSYKGPCARLQKELPLLTQEQRAAWAKVCEADYPCLPTSCSPLGTDYNETCPLGWELNTADGVCYSKEASPSGCEKGIRGDASPAEKAAFERRCKGARWPCVRTLACLEKNYAEPCPQGWLLQEASNACAPPPAYVGPCRSIRSGRLATGIRQRADTQATEQVKPSPPPGEAPFRGYSALEKSTTNEDTKMALEKKCNVSWPCVRQDLAPQRNYSAPCPLGWTLLADELCEAPPDYAERPNCPRSIRLLSPAAKAAMAVMCPVEYPFKREHIKQTSCWSTDESAANIFIWKEPCRAGVMQA